MALVGLLFFRAREAARIAATRTSQVGVLMANAADALAVVGAGGEIKFANPAAQRIFGVSAADSVGRPVLDFFDRVHPDEHPALERRLRTVIAKWGAVDTALVQMRGADGDFRSLVVTASNRLGDPAVKGVVLNIHDVTEETRASAGLRRLEAAMAQASDAVVIADSHANIEYVNPAFELTTGYSLAEVVGLNPRFLQSGTQKPGFYRAMWATLTGGQPWTSEFVNKRKDGSTYVAEAVVSPIRDASGAVTGYVSVSRDVTAEREQVEQAALLARQRATVRETIRKIDGRQPIETIAQTLCSQVLQLPDLATAALVVFELDERAMPYGIATVAGNVPLRQLPKARAQLIRQRASGGPWIEAWEPGTTHPYTSMLNRLGVKASAYVAIRDGADMVGYLVITTAAQNAEAVLTDALPALVEIADICATILGPQIAQRTARDAHRQRLLQIADGVEFFPVYQPLVDLATGANVGFEALTRFNDGVVPDVRFAEAHALGVGPRLELAAINAALAGARSLPVGAWLNINASPAVILDSGVELRRLIAESDREIVLEVTEHTEITDYAAFRRAVHELGLRVRLAVDDAGAGFASLRHIVELKPSFVKLDRQVISGIDHDDARQAMVAGLHHFALSTGCWLIAEGVETEAELATLRSLDVRYVQGFLLGRPIPAAEFPSAARPVAN